MLKNLGAIITHIKSKELLGVFHTRLPYHRQFNRIEEQMVPTLKIGLKEFSPINENLEALLHRLLLLNDSIAVRMQKFCNEEGVTRRYLRKMFSSYRPM